MVYTRKRKDEIFVEYNKKNGLQLDHSEEN